MDGLSGGASVIAVVSVAIQLQESIQKLIEFWNAVQDAPAGINDLFEELETLSAVLALSDLTNRDDFFDALEENVLRRCKDKISLLRSKILKPLRGLNSPSSSKRIWTSVKTVLKQAEFESLRKDIERATSILKAFKLISIENKLEHQFHIQATHELQLSNILTHLELSRTTGYSVQALNHASQQGMQLFPDDSGFYLTPNPSTNGNIKLGHPKFKSQKPLQSPRDEAEKQIKMNFKIVSQSAKAMVQRQEVMRSSERTILWMFQKRTRIRRITTSYLSGTKKSVEKDVDFFFCPPEILKSIGIVHGLWMNSRGSTGLSYSLQTFNAVPENALIFEFCREGNLAGIQTLFKLGQASVRDRDPAGRTPLWIAAQSLQLEVAEFLLKEGADPHVRDWRGDNPPLSAIRESKELDVTKKLSMIHLFQNYSPDGHDESKICHLMGLLMLFYRPRKVIPMAQKARRTAALNAVKQLATLFPIDDNGLSHIFFGFLQFYYEKEVLHWPLRNMSGMIDERGNDRSAIHDAIGSKLLSRDFVSVELIARKTRDLHRFWEMQPKPWPPGTPTSLSMYQPGMFYPWVRVLRNLGCDLKDFVREELKPEESVLKKAGWEEVNLLKLFESEPTEDSKISPEGWYHCDRCGRSESSTWTKIDLAWRRRMQSFRTGQSTMAIETLQGEAQHINSDVSETVLTKKKGEQESIVELEIRSQFTNADEGGALPYHMVCSDQCGDGICVAWVFEDGASGPIFLPAYPWKDPDAADEASEEEEEERCPTRTMPGAFVD